MAGSITKGRITNNTGETILVYGPPLGSTYHNSLYFLPTGRKTPSGWDCDGLYVSNDRLVKQALMPDKRGPVAVKYSGVRFPVITLSDNKYECPFNEGVFTPQEMIPGGAIYWEVPNISRSNIPGNYPMVPDHAPID